MEPGEAHIKNPRETDCDFLEAPEKGRISSMKILLYSHYFFPSSGGVEKTTLLLARYLEETGHQATIITQIQTSEEDAWPFRVIRRPKLRRLISEINQTDIVHLQGFVLVPFVVAKTLGRPVIWAHHGYDLTCPKQIGWKDGGDASFRINQCIRCLQRDHDATMTLGLVLLLFVKRFFKRFVDAHVAPSNYLLRREGLDGLVIPNPVDTGMYAPGPQNRPKNRILFVGRLIEEKGVGVLLEALEILNSNGGQYDLEIVGTGQKIAELQGLVQNRKMQNHVSFSRSVPEEKLVEKIQSATVVAAPTLNAEPFGIVGIEAMSCATPFIATNRGGFLEFAEGVATLVPPGDAVSLAQAIQKVSLEGNSSPRLLVGRQRMVSRYDYRITGAEYLRLYEHLLSRS